MIPCPPRCRVCVARVCAVRGLAVVLVPLTAVAVCVGLAL